MRHKRSEVGTREPGVKDGEDVSLPAPQSELRTSDDARFASVYESVRAWCAARDYAGHDPFDALNSRLFQFTPLRRWRTARLIWTQLFKRSPVNLRTLARVPAGHNAKGTALFALAALARFRAGAGASAEREARALLARLSEARLTSWSGAAWGYNFDWQGRAFFAPAGTPAIVPTAFAVRALVEAARDLEGARRGTGARSLYLETARSACDFILRDLVRSVETEDEICFSYTPHDRTRVFNASLLAAESLAAVGALTGETHLLDVSVRAARYVLRQQRADGSWPYGADDFQSWADNFHTAFVLTSLKRIGESAKRDGSAAGLFDDELAQAIRRGYEFWRESFFLADGWPKYYHDRKYPADAHSAGAAIVALLELRDADPHATELARRVARWTIDELFDAGGFFCYQRRRFTRVCTPYMRWSQAWMLYALARMLESS